MAAVTTMQDVPATACTLDTISRDDTSCQRRNKSTSPPVVNEPLVRAIANAHRWQRQLESGDYASLEDLAREVGVDRSYLGRMLRLTSLAPDIVEAILRGDEPDGLSLERLRKGIPLVWGEQREQLT